MQIAVEDAVEQLSECFLILDSTGKILSCNLACTELTGYGHHELESKLFSLLGDPDLDAIKYQYELDRALVEKKLVAEGWKTRKEGSRFWSEVTYSAILRDGAHMGYSVLLRDVSERKQLEMQLLQSEQRYRLMVEGVKEYSIFMVDPAGHILTWNEGGTLIQGYIESEVLGQHFSMFYAAEDLRDNKPERELEVAKQTGVYREEGWRVRKNGSLFWASVVMTSLFNEQNELIGYSRVVRDLTERFQAEAELRSGETRYRSLVEQVGDYGIFMLDTKGRIVSWNEGAKRIKGYTAEDVIGKYFSIFYPEEDILSGKPARELRVARATGKYEEEGWRIRKDGSRFWANIVITAVYNQSRHLIGFSKVTRDLTERKMAQQKLQENANKYRQLVQDLWTTNRRLTAVNRELEEFTAVVSHDLKEPVRTVKSFLHVTNNQLARNDLNQASISVGKCIRGAERMQHLIDSLLDYSQVGKGYLKGQTLSLKDVLVQVELNLEEAIKQCGAEIRVNLAADHLVGDKLQLVQLFQNLVSNALKFNNGQHPQVTINTWHEGDDIRIVVADNGIGIPPDQHKAIFGIFKRLHFRSEYPGTGVGLAICKKVVERHHGQIWADSSAGEGASFHIRLPINGSYQNEQPGESGGMTAWTATD